MDPRRRRLPIPDAWLRPSGPRSPSRQLLVAVGLGWLVLMTVWGIGRSGFPELERWFLVAGAVAAVATVVITARRASRR